VSVQLGFEREMVRGDPQAVVQVEAEMPVQQNHVYVIPPNTTLRIADGRLKLKPRTSGGERYMPIDAFLNSLAADQKSNAFGVILSGTASDGTRTGGQRGAARRRAAPALGHRPQAREIPDAGAGRVAGLRRAGLRPRPHERRHPRRPRGEEHRDRAIDRREGGDVGETRRMVSRPASRKSSISLKEPLFWRDPR